VAQMRSTLGIDHLNLQKHLATTLHQIATHQTATACRMTVPNRQTCH
jgi:hypothetical protein